MAENDDKTKLALAVIEERVKNMDDRFTARSREDDVWRARVEGKIDQALSSALLFEKSIDKKIDEYDDKLQAKLSVFDTRYASKLTQNIVYTMVGVILMGVLGALISLVVIKR